MVEFLLKEMKIMGRLVLGLDIGITSVGYGVIDIDRNDLQTMEFDYLKKELQLIMKKEELKEELDD